MKTPQAKAPTIYIGLVTSQAAPPRVTRKLLFARPPGHPCLFSELKGISKHLKFSDLAVDRDQPRKPKKARNQTANGECKKNAKTHVKNMKRRKQTEKETENEF